MKYDVIEVNVVTGEVVHRLYNEAELAAREKASQAEAAESTQPKTLTNETEQ